MNAYLEKYIQENYEIEKVIEKDKFLLKHKVNKYR